MLLITCYVHSKKIHNTSIISIKRLSAVYKWDFTCFIYMYISNGQTSASIMWQDKQEQHKQRVSCGITYLSRFTTKIPLKFGGWTVNTISTETESLPFKWKHHMDKIYCLSVPTWDVKYILMYGIILKEGWNIEKKSCCLSLILNY